ncbi:hypothetical protein FSB78_14400 [Sphingomonas ginsenosidivorax]|uniref:Uncharacterized protein n=1 Tax=Sphingomonas ginsenosidivorax TaxID=862135 RepID=A0A5C6UIF5_9SPHN|nr:hypothetical protein [Sphingomonas ginsenosidivorax]TXC72006.1 hypothetical protein FSB78_14400 [Sphingomonas ginsenosidivorax]
MLADLAQSLIGPRTTKADRQRASQLAVQALRRDVTAVPALVALGLNSQLKNGSSGARPIFDYVQRLTRRNLQAELWQIQDSAVRGNVSNSLRHIDIALRTSRQAPDLLFPVLGAVIQDVDTRERLARIMLTHPRWNELFIPYVAGNGQDPLAVAALFRRLAAGSIVIPAPSQAIIVARLVTSHPDQAWAYYASFRPGVTRTHLRDGRFSTAIVEPSPFDWVPTDDTSLSVSILRAREGGAVELSVPSSSGGQLLSQFQYLPPGIYDLRGKSADITQASAARLYWKLDCEGGRELGRVEMLAAQYRGGRFAGHLSVLADCPIQRLSLVARPNDAIEGLTGRITEVRLAPVGER